MVGPGLVCEAFLEGMSLSVFDCTVKVRRNFAVSSVDYRMKPSRHKLKSLSLVLLWMKMFA